MATGDYPGVFVSADRADPLLAIRLKLSQLLRTTPDSPHQAPPRPPVCLMYRCPTLFKNSLFVLPAYPSPPPPSSRRCLMENGTLLGRPRISLERLQVRIRSYSHHELSYWPATCASPTSCTEDIHDSKESTSWLCIKATKGTPSRPSWGECVWIRCVVVFAPFPPHPATSSPPRPSSQLQTRYHTPQSIPDNALSHVD